MFEHGADWPQVLGQTVGPVAGDAEIEREQGRGEPLHPAMAVRRFRGCLSQCLPSVGGAASQKRRPRSTADYAKVH